MRTGSVNKAVFSPNFGDALSTKQEKEFKKLIHDIRQEQGYGDGINIAKFYIPSLPSNKFEDTGIGKINSKEAERAYEIANVYYGATSIKIMPNGPLTDKGVYTDDHYVGSYNRGALAIGEDAIDIMQLATPKYGNIINKKDAIKLVLQHATHREDENIIDFETTLGWKNQEDYPVNEILRTAFDNFKNPENNSAELQTLRREFEEFKNQKEPVDYDDIYTRLALYPVLKDIGTAQVDFFRGFDSNPEIKAGKMQQYEELKEQHADRIEFFKFKQFLGHKALADGREIINSKGMDMVGDCIIGFSWPEKQVFPDAFLENAEVGWGLPALNFYDLINDNSKQSAAHKLLKAKVAHYLINYDRIRFDVGWQYMNPRLEYDPKLSIPPERLDAGVKITDFIEQTAREIKGEDFDQKRLMYECDADYPDFPIQTKPIQDKIKHIKGLVILSTVKEKEETEGWGNAAYMRENLGLQDDDCIVGTNNHDEDGVLNCAKNKGLSSRQAGAMMRVFKLRPQDGVKDGWKLLKDDDNLLSHIQKYCRARFAEIITMKNTFIQFFDILGRQEKIDYHSGGKGANGYIDYKFRLERNYEENFHRALQDGVGYNAADVHKFRMERDGTKKRRPDLYEKAAKYAAYLQHKGGIYTREQADASPRANLNIESLTLDEIKNMH